MIIDIIVRTSSFKLTWHVGRIRDPKNGSWHGRISRSTPMIHGIMTKVDSASLYPSRIILASSSSETVGASEIIISIVLKVFLYFLEKKLFTCSIWLICFTNCSQEEYATLVWSPLKSYYEYSNVWECYQVDWILAMDVDADPKIEISWRNMCIKFNKVVNRTKFWTLFEEGVTRCFE